MNTLQQVNPALAKTSSLGKAKRMPKHLIVLAKNQTGLRNLYKLISLAHLNYFKRFPIMPKSEINRNREGLILGSACEAGELYQAIVRGKDWEELLRIASWYDYLEIQPLSNNGFMVRPDKNGRTIARDWEQIREWNRTVVRLGRSWASPSAPLGTSISWTRRTRPTAMCCWTPRALTTPTPPTPVLPHHGGDAGGVCLPGGEEGL
ncbi:MAG: PHP domain-containing protein [Evtepia gabavorous]